MKNYRLLIGVGLVAVLLAGNVWLHMVKPPVNVSEVVFKTLSDKTIALTSLKGKPVLVTFWATSCGVCMSDLPKLKALHERYLPKGLHMFSVAMPYDDPATVRRVAQDLPFYVVLDADEKLNKAFGRVMFTPTTVLFETDGEVVLMETGPFDHTKFEAEISKMI